MVEHDSPERRRQPTPLWVKVFAGAAAALLTAFVVLHVTGNGLHHGPH